MPDQPRALIRPVSVTVALGFAAGAAVLNALIAALALLQIPRALASPRVSNGPAQTTIVALLVVIAVIAVVYSVTVVAFALLFRRGRPWARVAFFGASLLSLFPLFAPNGPAIAVILLLAVADVLLFRAEVSAWVRALRGLRPA